MGTIEAHSWPTRRPRTVERSLPWDRSSPCTAQQPGETYAACMHWAAHNDMEFSGERSESAATTGYAPRALWLRLDDWLSPPTRVPEGEYLEVRAGRRDPIVKVVPNASEVNATDASKTYVVCSSPDFGLD